MVMTSLVKRLAPIAVLLAFGLAACAPGLRSGDYSRGQVGSVNSTDSGTVLSVRQVQVEGTKSGVGSTAGTIIGGVGGASAGGDRVGRAIGGVVGGVLGGIAGAATEEGVTRRVGHEYLIQRSGGDVVTIVQVAEGSPLPPGSRVLIIYGDRARVVRDTASR